MRIHGNRVRQAKIGSQGLSFHYLNGYDLSYERFLREKVVLGNRIDPSFFYALGNAEYVLPEGWNMIKPLDIIGFS
jgi:hypothetical protein